jgi:hypothetical protein
MYRDKRTFFLNPVEQLKTVVTCLTFIRDVLNVSLGMVIMLTLFIIFICLWYMPEKGFEVGCSNTWKAATFAIV